MTYVVIHGRGLEGRGLAGRNRLAGLGLIGAAPAAPMSDDDARDALRNAFLNTTAGFVDTLNKAINDLPLNQTFFSDARNTLTSARNRITMTVSPLTNSINGFGVAMIRDTSLSVSEAAQRSRDFLASYLENVQTTLNIASQQVHLDSLDSYLNIYENACLTVIAKVGKAAGAAFDAATKGLPAWVPLLLGAAGVVYVVHTLRSR